jgi:acyl-CoA reductase-like NAD-dependent aldehyde dehydrogenase
MDKCLQAKGSTGAGRAIGAIAGQKLNSYTAELGGKAPLVVFGKSEIGRLFGTNFM